MSKMNIDQFDEQKLNDLEEEVSNYLEKDNENEINNNVNFLNNEHRYNRNKNPANIEKLDTKSTNNR